MSRDEQRVSRFYSLLTRWFVLRQSVAAVTVWAFVWGTAILILKAMQGTSDLTLLWGAVALPFVLGELSLPFLPEVPGRAVATAGMTGRTLGLVAELDADLQPAGWRLTGTSGAPSLDPAAKEKGARVGE